MIKLPQASINFYKENIDEIFNSGNMAEGKWNKNLAEYVQELAGAKVAVPTNSNGAGIVALLTIYRHYFGRDKVLIQSNTMYGVKTMVPSAGCSLNDYIECQIEILMPGIEDVEKAILNYSKDEKAELVILLSHIGGIINPDIREIADLCKSENIFLVEDCAHSFGATLNNEHSGLFGNAGVYSFYSTKAIPAGEGGMVITNDEAVGQMAKDFSIYDRFNQKLEIGFNNRISEPQALLTYSVVKEWENIVANKVEIAEKYINVCKELDIHYIKQNENGQLGNYYKFILYHPEVPVSKYFPFLKTKTSPVYDYSIGVENPVAENHLCLPIWYGQEWEITNNVIQELKKCFTF